MKNQKTTIIVVALLAVLFAALGGFFLLRGGEDAPENINQAEGSSYITWSEAAFEQNADQERWLYFHAEWCPECRALEADIKANLSDIPAGVVIFKIEYDDYQDLRQRWQVLRQTTVVSVDAQGEKIQEVLAAGSKNNLAAVIEALYVAPLGSNGEPTNEGDSGKIEEDAASSTSNAGEAANQMTSETPPGGSSDSGGTTGSNQNETTDSAGQYVTWSEAAFEQNADQERWLYFHAEWCPECRALEADIKANLSDIPAGVVIFKIEYDDYQDLRQRWQVLRQTTVVSVDAQGEKIQEVLAAGSKNNLAGVIGALK